MRWSWKIAEFAGIGVYMHATFLLLIIWIVMSHLGQGEPIMAALAGVLFILAIFLCVVLHEFGHALTARRYGIKTRDITLYPIGGVARLERMPDDPLQELRVALAGPAVNVMIAAILLGVLQLTGTMRAIDPAAASERLFTSGPFFERLMIFNVWMVLFNMLPAFPMDGGRVLRAALATRLSYARATHIAAVIGQFMALGFGLLGLFGGNPFLVFIALFVWIGAAQESGMAQMKQAFGGIPVSHAMLTEFHTLSPGDSLSNAVDLILAGSQQDFPVLEDGRVVGVLTRNDLVTALSQRGKETPVGEVMRRDFQPVDAREMLDVAFARLKATDCNCMPVLHLGRLVGLLTAENVGEFLMIQSALNASGTKRPPRLAVTPR